MIYVKISFYFQPPKKETWNGNISGYHVGYKIYNSTDPHVYKSIQMLKYYDDELSLQLTGLHKFTRYGIVLKAFNDHGNGPDSDDIVAMTAEDGKFFKMFIIYSVSNHHIR